MTVRPDRSFHFEVRTPTTSYLLLKCAEVAPRKNKVRGAMEPGKESVGQVSLKHIYEIAKIKQSELRLSGLSLEGLCKSVIAQGKSIGVEVVPWVGVYECWCIFKSMVMALVRGIWLEKCVWIWGHIVQNDISPPSSSTGVSRVLRISQGLGMQDACRVWWCTHDSICTHESTMSAPPSATSRGRIAVFDEALGIHRMALTRRDAVIRFRR